MISGIEVVLVQMKAVLRLDALRRNAGTDDLRQAVDVDGLDPEPLLDLVPHFIGPGLGPEEPHAQLDRVEIHLHFAGDVVDVERKGRRGGEHGASEVLQEHDLLLCVAAGDRDDRGAHALGPVVRAQPAGEQPVAVGVLNHVLVRDAGAGEGPGHDLGPEVDVVPVIGDDRGLARGAR